MKDAEKWLKRRLATVLRKGGARLPIRTVHHWRGRRFITAKRCVISVFASPDPRPLQPLGIYRGVAILGHDYLLE